MVRGNVIIDRCDYECIGVPKELIDSVDEKLDLSTYPVVL